MTAKLLQSATGDGLRHLILNRPECINALDEELCLQIDDAVTEAEKDSQIRCLLVSGAGGRGFSAGYDLNELSTYSLQELREQNARRYELMWKFATSDIPIIVAIHGACMGAGAILACCADIRIGAHDTTFRFTAAAYGSAMLTWCLPQLVGSARSKDYLMSSRPVLADEALAAGLLNRVTPAEALIDNAREYAGMIARNPPAGPRNVKKLINQGHGLSLRERWTAERDMLLEQEVADGVNPTREMADKLKSRPKSSNREH